MIKLPYEVATDPMIVFVSALLGGYEEAASLKHLTVPVPTETPSKP